MVRCATVLFIFGRFSQIFGENVRFVRFTPPPPYWNICSKSCLKRGSGISVRLWNFAGFLTRNCSFVAYFCVIESKRKLFEKAGLPACARRYGWHDGGSIAQMVESGKFGWALSESGFSCLALPQVPEWGRGRAKTPLSKSCPPKNLQTGWRTMGRFLYGGSLLAG